MHRSTPGVRPPGSFASYHRRVSDVRLFLVDRTGDGIMSLRRYRPPTADYACPNPGRYGCCDASVDIAEIQVLCTETGTLAALDPDNVPAADPRWPTACAHCGRIFEP